MTRVRPGPWRRLLGSPLLSLGMFLGLWEMAIRVSGLNLKLFPPPSSIAAAMVRLLGPPAEGTTPVLLTHLSVSVGRLAIAVSIATIAGIAVGVFIGVNRYAYRCLHPVITALFPIPPYAYIPIMLLWMGQGSTTIVIVTALAASLPVVYNTAAGVRGVDPRYIRTLRTFGAGGFDVVRHVLVPAALIGIVSGLRLSFGQAWRTLVGAEFIAAPDAGLGYLIYSAREFLAVDVMFAGLMILGVFGVLVVYGVVGRIEERTVVRWGVSAKPAWGKAAR